MDYFPDGDLYTPGSLYDVQDFAPNNNGAYERIRAATPLTTNPARSIIPRAAGIVKTASGTTRLYMSDFEIVFQADGSGGWTHRTGTTSQGTLNGDFMAFGEYILFANGIQKMQAATANGNFTEVADAPAAQIGTIHANAVVLFNTSSNRAGWYRSATGDHTVFTATASNDADSGTLYGGVGGPITAATTFGNLLIAWKARAMYGAVYAGNTDPDQPVLRWQTISTDVGCVAQHAWVATDVGVVFVSERDIMLFSGGKPISIAQKVRKAFFSEAAAQRSKIFLTHSEAQGQVFIWYAPTGETYCTKAAVWNYRRMGMPGEWGRIHTLNDTDPTNIGAAVCPVRNANYEDLVAIGGLSTNSERIANVIYGEKLLANLSSSTLNTDGLLRTGLIGRPDGDSVLRRVHVMTDGYAALPTTPTLVAKVYPPDKSNVQSKTASSLTNGAWWDIPTPRGRYVELQATFPSAAGVLSIADMRCEIQPYEPDKGWRLV